MREVANLSVSVMTCRGGMHRNAYLEKGRYHNGLRDEQQQMMYGTAAQKVVKCEKWDSGVVQW